MMVLLMLVAAHFLFDYPLQGDFLSKAKNRASPLPGVPWYQALIAHAFLQGAAAAFITGLWWLLIPELVIHGVTDDLKCQGCISFNQDQYVHLGCKLIWFLVYWSLSR